MHRLLLYILLSISFPALCGEIVFVEKSLPKVGYTSIRSNHVSGEESLVVFPKTGATFKDYSVKSLVEFGINLNAEKYYPDSMNIEVDMMFYDLKAQNNSALLPFTYTLRLRYHPQTDRNYIDKALLQFDKAYEFKSRVTAIRVNGALQDSLPKNTYILQHFHYTEKNFILKKVVKNRLVTPLFEMEFICNRAQ